MESVLRPMCKGDIAAILSIQEERFVEHTLDYANGFLVHLATRDQIASLLDNEKGISLVCENAGRVDAYCLSYRLAEWTRCFPDWAANVSLDSHDVSLEPESTLYFRHVAKRRDFPGFGQILGLERGLIKEAQRQKYRQIVGEIVCEPEQFYNRASFRLHNALGYETVGSVKYPSDVEGMKWALLHREIKETDK